MRTPLYSGSLLTLSVAFHAVHAARFLHSIPEDTYAFPKFRVAFLNGLPVLNDTVQRWLAQGLRGGELEFLGQPWQEDNWQTSPSPKGIGTGNAHDDGNSISDSLPASPLNYSLEHMRMGPRDSYICLIPKPADNVVSAPAEESDAEVTPARSWSLLQPLTGTCLYHRQGWFTYSYCHNEEIRQFKELVQTQPHSPGAYRPEEDPEWESYTLGRAPPSPEPGADLTVAEQNAHAVNLALARNAGSRYLVQRWGDGTLCDKTGKNREVEVQFHCSMTMTDTILFVKETKTCSYVLVVHTPRLCGEPGFKSRHDSGEETVIRCREIVTTEPQERMDLPHTDHPFKVPRRKPVLPPPVKDAAADGGTLKDKEKIYGNLIKKTLEALIGSKVQPGTVVVENLPYDENLVIEILHGATHNGGEQPETADRLADALRAQGYDVKAGKPTGEAKKGEKGEGKKAKKDHDASVRDEL